MITIRPATMQDQAMVVELGLEGLASNPYEHFVISKDKVKNVARECISSAANYCWVAEDEHGVVVAAVSAFMSDFMFYERKQMNVVQFWTRQPGAGIKLLRHFLKWARGRRAIKMIIFTLEANVDPRVGLLMKRLGLKTELPIYVECR